MASFPDVPETCIALLEQLSKRNSQLALTEENPKHKWLFVANEDGRETIAWNFLYALRDRGLVILREQFSLGCREQAFVKMTPEGKAAFSRHQGIDKLDQARSEWQTALARENLHLVNDVSVLFEPLPKVAEVQDIELLRSHLRCLESLKGDPGELTLRALSAKYFFGMSKYLESLPKKFVDAIYGDLLDQTSPRKILINVRLAATPAPWLFIENLDTFHSLCALKLPYHLIYSQGFKAAASRIRLTECVTFSYLHSPSSLLVTEFERTWLSLGSVKAYFWGDLDFSGVRIKLALQRNFESLEFWMPAYSLMLSALRQGHAWDGMANQSDPGVTGESYADGVLLPRIRQVGRFLDQEWVSMVGLETSLALDRHEP